MLSDHDRFSLLKTYRMPRCRLGGFLRCRIRGEVKVVAISEGRIQWPMTRQANGGNTTMIVCGDLVKAIKQESNQAVAFHWGVSAQTVSLWRKELGVGPANKGTRQLRSRWWVNGGTGEAARPGREATLHSEERAAKISLSKKGKARPAHVAEMLRNAMVGKKHTEEAKARMSRAHRARGSYPPAAGRPFTPQEDSLLGTMPDKDVAALIGRPAISVAQRRIRLGIDSHRKRTRGW